MTSAEAEEAAAALLLAMPADEPLDDEPRGRGHREPSGRGLLADPSGPTARGRSSCRR